MNAIEFVKMFGLEWAEHAVENMPKKWNECYLRISNLEFVKSPPSVSDWVCVHELKEIVEAFELVEKHGGVFSANCKIENECPDPEFGEIEYYVDGDIFFTPSFELVKAIKLVEQCQ